MLTDSLHQKVIKGDIAAFEDIFKQLYPSMCVVARNYLKDSTAAEDIAQEAFIKLWNSKEQYEEFTSLKNLLYVYVKNACLNQIRHNKLKNEHEISTFQEDYTDFKNLVIEEETYRIIQQAIQMLPRQSAKIISLSMQGVKNQEIAERLNISVNTVKTLKYNALKKLKKQLGDYFYVLLLFFIRI